MTSQTVRDFIRLPVTDQESAETYIRMLVQHDCIYHLEDNPVTEEFPCFSRAEARLVARRMRTIYALPQPWLGYDCPMGYLMQATERWNLTKLSHAQKLLRLRTIKWIDDDTDQRRKVIAILEWEDRDGDFVDCSDAELKALLADVQKG